MNLIGTSHRASLFNHNPFKLLDNYWETIIKGCDNKRLALDPLMKIDIFREILFYAIELVFPIGKE